MGQQDEPRSPGAILRESIQLDPNIPYSKDDFCDDLRRIGTFLVPRSTTASVVVANGHLTLPAPTLILQVADNTVDAMATFFSKYGDGDAALGRFCRFLLVLSFLRDNQPELVEAGLGSVRKRSLVVNEDLARSLLDHPLRSRDAELPRCVLKQLRTG